MVKERSFDASTYGTPESDWRSWNQKYSPLDLSSCREMIVVAPHPDDEVLGVGGLMSIAAASGVRVSVVSVTDGGASHPGSPTMTPEKLVSERPRESRRALAHLGVDLDPIRLGFPDGAVPEHELELTRALIPLLSGGPGTWCVTTWRGDKHPDHEATARACLAAARPAGIAVLEYPVWMWHWAHPSDNEVPWGRAFGVDLDEHTVGRKQAAVAEFRTQIAPLSDHPADRAVLPSYVTDRLVRPYEVVFA